MSPCRFGPMRYRARIDMETRRVCRGGRGGALAKSASSSGGTGQAHVNLVVHTSNYVTGMQKSVKSTLASASKEQ